ncbi:putative vacuolar membrane transporter for cationic amino acids [Linderina macrospora]|uniref:Vacuolar membrane transporter for cationic amino acids n=1 Tax=Linderina macrospora TaxID=4868 RepID=A0ACC1JFH8_9FUNG|nr:putative vacuolar membrane transporter for cationic amino acids [Linderina macrospora]
MFDSDVGQIVSSVFGYASIACWFVVLMPQIHLNYKRKSCEGVSLTFYLMWSLGDAFNLAGACLENMIPTAIILPLYYIMTDTVVLAQFYRYRGNRPIGSDGEQQALLNADTEQGDDTEPNAKSHTWKWTTLATVLALGSAAVAAYVYASNLVLDYGHLRKAVAQLCGFLSAAVYLGAYFPQLLENYRSKSCEGLSVAMFVLVILANITYCLSILTYQRPTYDYLQKYAAWLLGAAGTIWLELAVLWQFYIYRGNRRC